MMAVLIIQVLILVTGSIVSAAVLPPNIQVVRKVNPDETGPTLEDSFSNYGCLASTCPTYSTCEGGNCCFCKCQYDYPNVVVNKTSVRCLSYGETNRIPSANCQYSFRNANEPLEVIPLIKAATGKIKFTSSSVRVDCSEDNVISVDPWQYLDVNAKWKNGEGDVFTVDFNTVGGRDGNKKDLTFLEWSAQLDAKYAGLLIKFSLKCAGRYVGCILAKINGTHTYNPPPTTTPPTTSLTTSATSEHTTTAPAVVQSSSTDSLQTTVQQQTTITIPPSPSSSVPPTFSMSPETTAVPTQGRSPPVSRVPPGPETSSKTAGAPTKSPAQQESPNGKTGASSSNKAVIPAVTVIAVLVGLICLVLLIVLYRKRKRRPAEKATKDSEADSEAKLNDYQESLYDELPDYQQSAGACDNPVYCDPTEEQFQRRSKQDPLPALPVSESTYQPLNQHTRNIPNIPAPPPVSYPLIKNDIPEEPSDYINPDREASSDAADNENSSIADYDNPPVSSVPPTDTQNVDKLNNESSDYDNPPVQGNNDTPTTNQKLELNNEAPDYDNPPVQGTPRESTDPLTPTSPSESVAEAAQEAEPEYFELEPTDSSL